VRPALRTASTSSRFSENRDDSLVKPGLMLLMYVSSGSYSPSEGTVRAGLYAGLSMSMAQYCDITSLIPAAGKGVGRLQSEVSAPPALPRLQQSG
jgi:hypothetical protein